MIHTLKNHEYRTLFGSYRQKNYLVVVHAKARTNQSAELALLDLRSMMRDRFDGFTETVEPTFRADVLIYGSIAVCRKHIEKVTA